MAATASPNGLIPKNLVGGGPYQGGTLREFPVKANVATAIYNGQLVATKHSRFTCRCYNYSSSSRLYPKW